MDKFQVTMRKQGVWEVSGHWLNEYALAVYRRGNGDWKVVIHEDDYWARIREVSFGFATRWDAIQYAKTWLTNRNQVKA